MVFYSLVFWRGEHWSNNSGQDHRQLIISSDRGIANYLFRLIQDRSDPIHRQRDFHEVQRLSPQMWSYCSRDWEVLRKFIDQINLGKAELSNESSNKIRGKVLYQHLDDWNYRNIAPILPDIDVADHIDGSVFCIRNKRVPERFWAIADGTTRIGVSTSKRSKFGIRIAGTHDREDNSNGRLMVKWDTVKLYLMEQNAKVLISKNKGFLEADKDDQDPAQFEFGTLLRGGFMVIETSDESDSAKKLSLKFVNPEYQGGEIWELC
ncbi:hypothetical protein PENNAL_c0022G03433 [Penicillium nalgiovense]|uniref:Uncharacterized protein n=1 Tax=Penicillium nalgiovense TaxID=60175 RepID=A0A1V6YG26_PENNA|nr:hypothetical protein PENNAL_c0022G03433 [Penicillium nalgiovense]